MLLVGWRKGRSPTDLTSIDTAKKYRFRVGVCPWKKLTWKCATRAIGSLAPGVARFCCSGVCARFAPETIAGECFPTLTLEQVYGAIAYYLANRTELDSYLKKADAEFESLRQTTRKTVSGILAEADRGTPANADG